MNRVLVGMNGRQGSDQAGTYRIGNYDPAKDNATEAANGYCPGHNITNDTQPIPETNAMHGYDQRTLTKILTKT
jgi:hypothetical protein